MIISADEEALGRMLGVPTAKIPERVLAEYELRLRMFHCNGNSGALGTIGLIDLVRSLGLAPPKAKDVEPATDWSRIPTNGSVRVLAKMNTDSGPEWVSGVYVGRVGLATLAVRLDGDLYVHEKSKKDVRIIRQSPVDAKRPDSETASDTKEEPGSWWDTIEDETPVMAEDGDDVVEGKFCGFNDGEVFVLVEGELTPRPFSQDMVTCIEDRLQVAAEK